ncbi:MAG: hypothetical protein IV094_01665 [Vitreoscilla sp.]|nr:hypothetical protein [Vitreoscilla sp.]
MNMPSRRRIWAAAAFTAAGLIGLATSAAAKEVAYYTPSDGSDSAYLIDWAKSKARVVNGVGAQKGVVTGDSAQRVVTLNSPFSILNDAFDSCDIGIQQRRDTNQVVVREGGKTAQIIEIGTFTNLGGCEDGLVTPFGSPTDEGVTHLQVAMAKRPPVTDLIPGAVMAGFSEDAQLPGEFQVAQDLAVMQAGSLLFQTTGNAVPASLSPDKWLLLALPFEQRGYTRLSVDAKTGGEHWLRAVWANGQTQRVHEALLVKPVGGASFGSVKQASRMWESGLFSGTRTPFYLYLYQDGNGERVSKNLDAGTETRTPMTWVFAGNDIVQTRSLGGGYYRGDRTWQPLRDVGTYDEWVMESEMLTDPDGVVTTLIKPRVNLYVDTGKAVPPARR